MEIKNIDVVLSGRDELHLQLRIDGDEIKSATLTGVGCSELLQLIQLWRPRLSGKLTNLELPSGLGHAEILFRELILKAKGEWDFPYKEDELCHCRAVATCKVDDAIITGARNVVLVSQRTSAGTSCGTCKPDIDKVLKYRLAR